MSKSGGDRTRVGARAGEVHVSCPGRAPVVVFCGHPREAAALARRLRPALAAVEQATMLACEAIAQGVADAAKAQYDRTGVVSEDDRNHFNQALGATGAAYEIRSAFKAARRGEPRRARRGRRC